MLDIATVLTTIFTYIDDFCKSHIIVKPGAKPVMKDSEIITIIIFTELMGVNSEYEQVNFVNQWLKEYFPRMIDRSQYHRRGKNLLRLINDVRLHVLGQVALALSDTHIIDSTPIPVISFQRAYRTPLFPEANFGKCAARKMTYYGFKLHLVTDTQGIPIHFDLTPANVADVSITEELLSKCSMGYTVIGDKGYLSNKVRTNLAEQYTISFHTPTRANMKQRESKAERKLLNRLRQRIETTNGMLKDQFSLEKTRAKTLLGLTKRIFSKLTAMTFGILINRLFERPLLALKSLV